MSYRLLIYAGSLVKITNPLSRNLIINRMLSGNLYKTADISHNCIHKPPFVVKRFLSLSIAYRYSFIIYCAALHVCSEHDRLDYQPLFGKGARAAPPGRGESGGNRAYEHDKPGRARILRDRVKGRGLFFVKESHPYNLIIRICSPKKFIHF